MRIIVNEEVSDRQFLMYLFVSHDVTYFRIFDANQNHAFEIVLENLFNPLNILLQKHDLHLIPQFTTLNVTS